jgi:hypothetical protein
MHRSTNVRPGEAPYPTHVPSHHSQLTSISPENAGPVRKISPARSTRNLNFYDSTSSLPSTGRPRSPRLIVPAIRRPVPPLQQGEIICCCISYVCIEFLAQRICPYQTSHRRRFRRPSPLQYITFQPMLLCLSIPFRPIIPLFPGLHRSYHIQLRRPLPKILSMKMPMIMESSMTTFPPPTLIQEDSK